MGTIGLAVVDALQQAGARKIIGVDTDEDSSRAQEMCGMRRGRRAKSAPTPC